MTSVLQMMRFKQGALGPSDPSLRLPALVLCLAVSLWAKTASGGTTGNSTEKRLRFRAKGPHYLPRPRRTQRTALSTSMSW